MEVFALPARNFEAKYFSQLRLLHGKWMVVRKDGDRGRGKLLCLCTAYLGVEFMLICLCQTIAKETRKENCEITFITFRFPLNFANAFTSRAESFARLKRWRS